MRWILRFSLMACLAIAAMVGSGCNVLSVPFYLFGPEEKIQASIQSLASEDKNKEVKVLIWTWSDRGAFDLDIPHADRRLAQKLGDQLKEGFTRNKEKVTLVPYKKVEEFRLVQSEIDPVEAGKYFKADYVIYLEIKQFSLSVPLSYEQLLKGRADITVNLINLNKDEEPKKSETYICSYPTETNGGMELNDSGNSKQLFAERFLQFVARQLSWKFTAHLREEDNQVR